MTNLQKLYRGIWPWTGGLKSRLPLHYKQRFIKNIQTEPRSVHYRADQRKYAPDEYGQPVHVQNVPIPIIFPREADEGLWGGEGIIAGFKQRIDKPKTSPFAKIWMPRLSTRVLYSEILDRWISVTVTLRTLDLIDESYGLDKYILSTPERDIRSKFGMRLKREMLLALANKSLYPNDPAKRDEIYQKYKQFEVPASEAEWVGLTLYEAERKQYQVEEAERLRHFRPLKDIYADELYNELMSKHSEKAAESPSKAWLSKLSPFKQSANDA